MEERQTSASHVGFSRDVQTISSAATSTRVRFKRKLQFTSCYEFKKIWADSKGTDSKGAQHYNITFFRVTPPKGKFSPRQHASCASSPPCKGLAIPSQASRHWAILLNPITPIYQTILPASSQYASKSARWVRPSSRFHPFLSNYQIKLNSLSLLFFALLPPCRGARSSWGTSGTGRLCASGQTKGLCRHPQRPKYATFLTLGPQASVSFVCRVCRVCRVRQQVAWVCGDQCRRVMTTWPSGVWPPNPTPPSRPTPVLCAAYTEVRSFRSLAPSESSQLSSTVPSALLSLCSVFPVFCR
jgi:hypothetical protein